jgi:hypothetical protein
VNFKLLKKKIVEKVVFYLPYFGRRFKVETDVTGTAIGVFLS